jgi:hypothetical protein
MRAFHAATSAALGPLWEWRPEGTAGGPSWIN